LFGLADLGFGCPELGYFSLRKSPPCACLSGCGSSATRLCQPPSAFALGADRPHLGSITQAEIALHLIGF
jgi:hypothetical protein